MLVGGLDGEALALVLDHAAWLGTPGGWIRGADLLEFIKPDQQIDVHKSPASWWWLVKRPPDRGIT